MRGDGVSSQYIEHEHFTGASYVFSSSVIVKRSTIMNV